MQKCKHGIPETYCGFCQPLTERQKVSRRAANATWRYPKARNARGTIGFKSPWEHALAYEVVPGWKRTVRLRSKWEREGYAKVK
jgi:hypothetical protein